MKDDDDWDDYASQRVRKQLFQVTLQRNDRTCNSSDDSGNNISIFNNDGQPLFDHLSIL